MCVTGSVPASCGVPQAGAFCLTWTSLLSVEDAPRPLQAGYNGGREGSTAAEAEIRQFWAPGQKNLALPFTISAVATMGWWDRLAPSLSSGPWLRPGSLRTGGKWEPWFGFQAPTAPGLLRSCTLTT